MTHRIKVYSAGIVLLPLIVAAWLLAAEAIGNGQTGEPAVPLISDDLDRESLSRAVQQSILYLSKLPADRIIGEQPRRVTAGEVLSSLREFERLVEHQNCNECWQKEIQTHFDLVPSSNDPAAETVLFTGYYQPVIEASLVPTAEYSHPIYGKPADLIVAEQVKLTPAVAAQKVFGRLEGEKFVPYYSRREIDQGGILRGRGYEIAWVKNPVDLFFLHIQGSGILQLADGRRLHVGYAAANGRSYRSVGRLLIDSGKVPQEEMSMQRLRRYFADHPDEQSEIMSYNESYIFFRFLEDGPLGSLDVPLTPGRSIATDAGLFPRGALGLMITEKPKLDAAGGLTGWEPLSRFVLNQDSGAAIRGTQRADIYFGSGAGAGAVAGYMNRSGKLYFLMLKNQPGSAAAIK